MNTRIAIALLLACLSAAAQPITYYIQGLHRQANAQYARDYLGIQGSNIFNWGTNCPCGTNAIGGGTNCCPVYGTNLLGFVSGTNVIIYTNAGNLVRQCPRSLSP